MAVKASSQKTLVDLTDGYSVAMTNDNYTFLGDEDGVANTQSTTSQIQALQGATQIPCKIGEISTPNGLSIVSDGKTPIPTLTITATSALKNTGSVIIPVIIGDITINKTFSWSIAFRGSNGQSITIVSQTVTYQVSSSGGPNPPSGTWSETIPTVNPGQYLWSKTVVVYSDSESTTAYGVSRNGDDGSPGESVSITSTSVTYQKSNNGTTPPTGNWSEAIPTVNKGEYLWTKTVVTYSDGTSTTSYSVSRNGVDGTNGEDAISMVITSSNGDFFKNTAIATTLTAHVYKGGAEVTGSSLTALGTIKWYKDKGASAVATGQTLTISAGDVTNKVTYIAQLEG